MKRSYQAGSVVSPWCYQWSYWGGDQCGECLLITGSRVGEKYIIMSGQTSSTGKLCRTPGQGIFLFNEISLYMNCCLCPSRGWWTLLGGLGGEVRRGNLSLWHLLTACQLSVSWWSLALRWDDWLQLHRTGDRVTSSFYINQEQETYNPSLTWLEDHSDQRSYVKQLPTSWVFREQSRTIDIRPLLIDKSWRRHC